MTRVRSFCYALAATCVLSASHVWAVEDTATPSLHPKVKIATNRGDIVVELDAEKAPGTVLNFIQYAEEKYYDGTIFHRVMKNFMIQGGGLTPDMVERVKGIRPPIRLESNNGLSNVYGTIAMARKAHPQSATAQFYFNVADNRDTLDYKPVVGKEGYAVFGKVVEGKETVEKIRDSEVAMHPKYRTPDGPVTPVEPVIIHAVTVLTPLDKPKAQSLAEQFVVNQEKAELEAKTRAQEALPKRIKEIETETKQTFAQTESGLKFIDVKKGGGATPSSADSVEIVYRGTLVDGTVFDSSQSQAETKLGKYDAGGVMTYQLKRLNKGLQEGIGSMQEGGKRILLISPDLAYGKDGIPGRIPPDSTIFYEVELMAVKHSDSE